MILEFLQDNQFASGLLVTGFLAAVVAYLRNIPGKLWTMFWAQLAVCAEIKNSDPAFNWLAIWLDRQPYSKTTRRLRVFTYNDDDIEDDYVYEEAPTGRRKRTRPKVLFTPAEGEHVFWYKGRLVWLSRSPPSVGSDGNSMRSFMERESIHLWVLGRQQNVIRDIVQDAMLLALPDAAPETYVIPSADGRWGSAIKRRPRACASVILEGDAMFKLMEDARQFLRTKQWYDDLGIPYRRGYLLHGEPGSGKTSAVLAIAGELGLDVYMLNLGDRYLDDGRLNCLLSQVPPGNIVLLEDIDVAFKAREAQPSAQPCNPGEVVRSDSREIEQTAVTFSGLLNALDGVAAREGRILFMTTNHRRFLDPALVRPGRADLHAEFGLATQDQARRMFIRFFPVAPTELSVRFGQLTPHDKMAMATIQDHLLTHKADAAIALGAWEAAVVKLGVPELPK